MKSKRVFQKINEANNGDSNTSVNLITVETVKKGNNSKQI